MNALRQALEAQKAQTYIQIDQESPTRPTGFFHRWLVRLFGHEDRGPVYSSQSVAEHLAQDYGHQVCRQVMDGAGQRPLTARRIVSMHNQAAKLKKSIDRDNSQHSRAWSNLNKKHSLAADVFTRIHGYSPSRLPDFEKNRLHQHIEQALFRHADHRLSTAEASFVIAEALQHHETGFSCVTGDISRVLNHTGKPFYPVDLDLWQSRLSLNFADRNLIRAFQYNSLQSARLQWNSPFDQLDQKEWQEQIDSTKEHIRKLDSSLAALQRGVGAGFSAAVREAMALDIYGQLHLAKQHISFLENLAQIDFRHQDCRRGAEDHALSTALLIVNNALAEGVASRRENAALMQLRNDLEQRLEDLPDKQMATGLRMSKTVKSEIASLQRQLADAGISSRHMSKRWRQASSVVSNTQKWETIEKTLPVRANGEVWHYKGTLTPAAQMRLHLPHQQAGTRDPFAVSYHGQGRSSAAPDEPLHAINLYNNKLQTESGRELYSGLRSGTLMPFGVKGTADLDQIVENRGRELLQAAFLEKFSKLPEEQQQRVLQGEILPMDFVSTSLLSPDRVRHATGVHDDELLFQRRQHAMLQRLCSQPLTIDIYDSQGQAHTVAMNVRLASLNVPVNNLALNPAISTAIRPWSSADSYTDTGLEALLGNTHPDSDIDGMVGDWLRNEGLHSPNRDIVQQLVYQIRMLYTQKLHHTEGQDAYKLVERVQLLAWMIGAVPHFNCKSGKDRTGEADAKVRHFAAEVDRLGYVPDPLAPPTREHRESVQTFLYGAGNLEIQQKNLNIPGYKTTMGREEQGDTLFRMLH